MTLRQSHDLPIPISEIKSRLPAPMSLLDKSRFIKRLESIIYSTKYEQLLFVHEILTEDYPDLSSYSILEELFFMHRSQIHRIITTKQTCFKECSRNRRLDDEQEKAIINHLNNQWTKKKPVPKSMLSSLISKLFQIDVSEGYVNSFLKRYASSIKCVMVHPASVERMRLSQIAIEEYHKLVRTEIVGTPNMLLFNLDESSINEYSSAKPHLAIVPTSESSPTSHFSVRRPSANATIMPCIGLDGSQITPLLVLKRKTLDPDVYTPACRAMIDIFIQHSEKGYNTKAIFFEWLKQCFIPQLGFRRTILQNPSAIAFVICDQASVHHSEEIDVLLRANNIRFVHFPPHASHIFQPLDLLTFGTLKRCLRRMNSESEDRPTQAARIHDIIQALQYSTVPMHIIGSFIRAGFSFKTDSFPHPIIYDNLPTDDRVKEFIAPPQPTMDIEGSE